MFYSKRSLHLGLLLNLVMINACFGGAGLSDSDDSVAPNDWGTFERRLFSPNPKEQMGAFFQQGISVAEIPAALAPKVAARLDEIAKTNGPSGIGGFAIMALGKLGPWASNSVPYLESLALDTRLDYLARSSAYDSLSTITTNAVTKTKIIEVFLKSRSDKLCESGVRAICAVPPADYQTNLCVLLTEILNTRTSVPPASVISAMGYVAEGQPAIIAIIKTHLASKDPAFRVAAIEALDRGKLLKADDMVDIGKLLSDDNTHVRGMAMYVLLRCGTNAIPAIPYLEAAASTNEDPTIAIDARNLLTKLRATPEK